MKHPRSYALACCLFALQGCEGKPAAPTLSESATDALGGLCTAEGAALPAGFSVTAHIEEQRRVERDWLTGVRFEISAGTTPRPALTAGAIGIAQTRGDAERVALDEWLGLFGQSYCAARARSPGAVEQGSVQAYPSPLGIRGEHPGGWLSTSEAMHEKVLRAVIEHVEPPAGSQMRILNLMVGVAGGNITGECRIDGLPSAEVLQSLQTLDWPEGTYVFKQNYVIVAASP